VKKSILLKFTALSALLLLILFSAGCSSSKTDPPPAATEDYRPVVFVHGGSGSASQFESQAQRFIANGYPLEYLAAYDHDTSVDLVDNLGTTNAALDEIIDSLLALSGAAQVDLIAHSRGAGVSTYYLESSPDRAAKVAHYVAVDSGTGLRTIDELGLTGTPGGVAMLALWGEGDPTRTVAGATNVSIPDQAHIQICTSAEAFVEMYNFFNNRLPDIDYIPVAEGDTVQIAGAVNYFPANVAAPGVLEIWEVDPTTGFRVADEPIFTWEIVDEDGSWGPVEVIKGATYEFAFQHSAGAKHYFYREPFLADNYFIRLNTSQPGTGIGGFLTSTPDHTNILITRDKEIWGDQDEGNDILFVDDASVSTPVAALRAIRLSGLFLMDWGPDNTEFPSGTPDQETDLTEPIQFFHQVLPFMSALDLFMPADPERTITVELTPRGGGPKQIVNVPAWPSDDIRITVHFRDFVRPVLPVVFVHGFAGSASQFESQAQRFMANGYPVEYLAAYDHDTGAGAPPSSEQGGPLDEIIDALLAATGAEKVNLMGHSRGGGLCMAYLNNPAYGAVDKIANYVHIDSFPGTAVEGVRTLALWGDGFLFPAGLEVGGATNIRHSDQAHIQVATSKESFADMFRFFNHRSPAIAHVPEARGDTVEIAGAVNYFPTNVGAPGTLAIYAIDPVSAARLPGPPVHTFTIDATGAWGPVEVDKGATYEFAFQHSGAGAHYFYREPLLADNYFIRLNTSDPLDTEALGNKIARGPNHAAIVISRDKEMWGDQGADNDMLIVDEESVLTEDSGVRAKHLSALFLMDWGPDNGAGLSEPDNWPDQETDLSEPIAEFHGLTFMSGMDLYMPANDPPNRAIAVEMTPRGGDGTPQIVNVPNWPSEDVRISVHFRDFVQ
jgi:triacylglycerol esterase/lipase EstA (alpha/beta hydrolase family)